MKHFSEISSSAERLVDAAEGLIQQRGYNGFSYDDVAKKVGIKKPSIHHHFATKSELVTVVTQRYTYRFLEQLTLIENQYAIASERLTAYASLFEQTFSNGRGLCLCGMLGAESCTLPEAVVSEIRHFFSENINWLNMVIEAGQRGRQIQTKLPAMEIAHAFVCILEGAMIVERAMSSARSPATIAQTFLLSVLE